MRNLLRVSTYEYLPEEARQIRFYEIEERDEVVFKNGAVYKGQWLGSEKHGFGVQQWPDGARYEGEWQYNKVHGKGKFRHADGDVYEGDWENDKAHGFGVYLHVNG